MLHILHHLYLCWVRRFTTLREITDDAVVYAKQTCFLRVLNQREMQAYLDTVTDALGLPRSERFFHVSIANETGNGQDSIGDISASDCTYGKRYDLWKERKGDDEE